MEHSARLIEIGGLSDVGGDDRVVLTNLGNTIHLDRKEHGDAISLQFSRKRYRFRGTPAHPINDDAGVLFLFGGQRSIMVPAQKSQDLLAGLLPATILEHLHIHTRGVVLPEARSKLDAAMHRIIVLDKPAHEANDDDR